MSRDPYEDIAPRYGVVKKGKLVTFYKNGDPHFRGLQTSVSGKHFVAMHTLLSWLNDKIDTINGVKHIFALPDGREITEVTRFEAGGCYVVSSVRPFLNLSYGNPRHRPPRSDNCATFTTPPHRFLPQVHNYTVQDVSSSDDLYVNPTARQQQASKANRDEERGRNNLRSSELQVDKSQCSPRSRSWGSPTRSRQQNQFAPQDSLDMPLSSNSSIINEMRQDLLRRDSKHKTDTARDSLGGSVSDQRGDHTDTIRSGASDLQQSKKRHSVTETYNRAEGSHRGSDAYKQTSRHRKQEGDGQSRSAPLEQFNKNQIWSPLSFQGEYYAKAKPRLLLITSNTDRTSRQRVIFNPRTLQSFEEVLRDIERLVNIHHPPVSALYTARPPYVKVLGISHLTRALRNCDELLACGGEGVPIEVKSFSFFQDRGPPPTTHQSNTHIRSSKSLDYINTGDALFAEVSDKKEINDSFIISKEDMEDKSKNLALQCGCKDCDCNVHKAFSHLIISESLSTKR